MRGVAKAMKSENAAKWRQYEFKNKKRGMMRLTDLDEYCVDSVVPGVAYIANANEFGIMRTEGMLVCKISEMPQLAKELLPVFRQEVLEIYKDLIDLKLMEVVYA